MGILNLPFAKADITSPYRSARRPNHTGTDFGWYSRNKDVRAAGSGTVTFAGHTNARGYQMEIDHGSGLRTRYHMLERGSFRFGVGARVNKGDIIARVAPVRYSGTPAENWTAPHLHFEVWRNGKDVDPVAFIESSANAEPATSGDRIGLGSRGERVLRVQEWLERTFPAYAKGKTGKDSYWGNGTANVFGEFQRRTGNKIDRWFTWGSGPSWNAMLKHGFKP